MIVCHCQAVSSKTIEQCCLDGATTVREIAEATGAGTDCGTCIDLIKKLLGESNDNRIQQNKAAE